MDAAEIKAKFDELTQKKEGLGVLLVLSKDGSILYASDPNFAKPEETKALMDAWLTTKPAIEIGGLRYPILKWDPLQLAARNTTGNGAIVGAVTKAGNYAVMQLLKNCTIPLLEAGVILNRWSWNLF